MSIGLWIQTKGKNSSNIFDDIDQPHMFSNFSITSHFCEGECKIMILDTVFPHIVSALE